MRQRSDFHLYQERMNEFILNNPFCALFCGMGLGKTVTSLTAIDTLQSWCEISKPLIVAPRLVAEMTWGDEIEIWPHLGHLKLSKVIGTAKQREKALTAEADIWIIGRDNLAWLVDKLGTMWPFDMVVLDESTSFKSHSSLRFRKMREAMKHGVIKRMVHLTGTPAPNGLLDLWAPLYLLDKGERLGTTYTGYRDRYFETNQWTHRSKLRPGAETAIHDKISDICISMQEEDWLDLPEREDIMRKIELPNMAEYIKFREEAVLALEDVEITAVNAGSLYTKLLQFCNGAVYDNTEDREYHVVHDAKLDLLEEIIESLNGEPVLVLYCFQSDADRIEKRIKNVRRLKTAEDKAAWNRGEVPVLLGHPAGIGHGLNLQAGGHLLIWYGVPSPLEWYLQALKRIHRQGQRFKVINLHITTACTEEEEVVKRLIDKTLTQDTLIDALRAFKNEARTYKESKVRDLLA